MVAQRIVRRLRSHAIARAMYGTIIGLALVEALERHPPSAAAIVATLLGTGVAVALAEIYSDVIASEVRTRHRIDRQRLRHFAWDGAGVLVGVAAPALWFALAAIGVIQLDTAFTVATWASLLLAGSYGYAAGRLAGIGVVGAIAQGCAIAVVAAVLVVIKALWH